MSKETMQDPEIKFFNYEQAKVVYFKTIDSNTKFIVIKSNTNKRVITSFVIKNREYERLLSRRYTSNNGWEVLG